MRALRPPFRPCAVVFDLDGVLVDSEGLWARAEARVSESFGHTWDPTVQEAMLGRGPKDAAAVLAGFLDVCDVEEVEARLLSAVREEFSAGVVARAGAAELVDALRGHVPLAVATNSRRVLAETCLDAAGLSDALAAVVTADEVVLPKPAPEVYLAACAALGVDPAASVAVEDSPVGAESARAAGCWVIGSPSRPGPGPSAAHVLVGDLGDIEAGALLAGPEQLCGPR